MNDILDDIKELQSKVDNYYEMKQELKQLTFDSNVNSERIDYCEIYSAEDEKYGWLKPAEEKLRNLKIDYLFEVEMKKQERTEL